MKGRALNARELWGVRCVSTGHCVGAYAVSVPDTVKDRTLHQNRTSRRVGIGLIPPYADAVPDLE
eukprot:2530896-Rhodomonas_salina.2